MGILYSHIVFQPPSPPSYSDDAGVMSFRKAKHDGQDSDDDQSVAPSTDATVAGSSEQQYVQHPIIYLRTSRGNSIPAAYFHQPDSYYTILFSHGNGEDLGITASYILELSNALRTSALCYDYSGYGLSTGKASESNCYADIRAAYTYLVAERRIAPSRIVLFGRSLGSGPTVDLAAQLGRQLGGVVLIAGLTSCVRVVFNSVTTMKFDMFANVDKMEAVEVPVFCVHGSNDDVVPFSHGLELYRKARYAVDPLWIHEAGHNNLESTRFIAEVFARYAEVLKEFRKWKPPPPPPVPAGAGGDGDGGEQGQGQGHGKRRESFGALAKAAGCFGVSKNAASLDGGGGGLVRHSRRRSRAAAAAQSLPANEFPSTSTSLASTSVELHSAVKWDNDKRRTSMPNIIQDGETEDHHHHPSLAKKKSPSIDGHCQAAVVL